MRRLIAAIDIASDAVLPTALAPALMQATETSITRDGTVDLGPRLYTRICLLRQFGLDGMLALAAVVSLACISSR